MNPSLVAPSPRRAEGPDAFAGFAARRHCVWLDTASGEGQSLLAAEPVRVFRAKNDPQTFERLRAELEGWPGYAIGYFGYELKNCIEKLPQRAVDDVGLPDCWFGFYESVVRGPAVPPVRPPVWEGREARCATGRHSFTAAVRRAKEYIAAGDIYQVNLSHRFQCEVAASPVEVYRALRQANPAPYAAYLDIGEAQILSSSPECFLKINGRHVVTRPIKGTRPVGCDPGELLASPKDNAELLMITDLERNDLGKVCEYGSVRVRELRRVETYATVHHLVATVEGTLRREVDHLDCVRACFPGGSITGAPKIRAMQIIDELEPVARGVYCGAIGYFGPNGESQFNIAIRTVVYQPVGRAPGPFEAGRSTANGGAARSATGRLTFHAGAGIVADSDPDAEYDEVLAKAQGIFHAIESLRVR